MRNKFLILLLIIVFNSCSSDDSSDNNTQEPPPELIGEVLYGPSDFNHGLPFYTWDLNTANNNLLIYGNFGVATHEEYLYFSKFDQNLNEVNTKFPIENINVDHRQVKSLVVNQESIYILNSSGYPSVNSKLQKIDLNGEIIWSKNLPSGIHARDLLFVNNQFIIAGFNSNISTEYQFSPSYILVLNNEGNLIKSFLLTDFYGVNNLLFVDGSFIATSNKSENGLLEPYIINFNVDGSINWTLKLDSFEDWIFHPAKFFIRKGSDGIYIAFRNRSVLEHQIAKVSFSGQLIWKKNVTIPDFSYNGFEFLEDIALDSENNIYLVGSENDYFGFGPRHLAVAKYDADGNLLKSYSHSTDDQWGQKVKILNNEIFTLSSNYPSLKISLLKFDKSLNIK